MERLENILKNAGFVNIDIDTSEVSEEYAKKWGIEFDLKPYMTKSIITAYKPL